MNFTEDQTWWDDAPNYDTRKSTKIKHDPSKHYPNKDEASLLRRIMAQTGLNEQEVRSHYKYSKMLSDAQKGGQNAKRTHQERFYHRLMKRACRKTGLVKEHPETISELDDIIDKTFNRTFVYGN